MRVWRDVAAMRRDLLSHRRAGRAVGLVPTMGALHPGHLSLVARAVRECDVVVASVFVNPLQFAPGEDLESYPGDPEGDAELLESAGVAAMFAPPPERFTPPGRRTTVHVDGLTDGLEGASRPTHFDGVTTIVSKLLHAAWPDRAYFGEKDYQQLVVVRVMARDLDMPVEIVGCPVVREPDGLAWSSRNMRLSASQRVHAVALSAALRAAAESWTGDADAARRSLRSTLAAAPGVRLDYAEVVDPETLEPLAGTVEGPVRALVAAWVGTTRLIDNMPLGSEGAGRGRAGR
ncbi:MAG: pantoate--beta-alanine ligase [Actinomycetota bacterium]|nr:pantoate--beta-alanine ligase [Actinomycetota bacterium]